MENIGKRNYLTLPGTQIYELPPLLVNPKSMAENLQEAIKKAIPIAESEGLVPQNLYGDPTSEQIVDLIRYDQAAILANMYAKYLELWCWGNDILRWIKQCEEPTVACPNLQWLLQTHIWPHTNRSSFVRLLKDKYIASDEVDFLVAVGLRLNFLRPVPMRCFTSTFLHFLQSKVALAAYDSWAGTSGTITLLPPERFTIQVINLCIS